MQAILSFLTEIFSQPAIFNGAYRLYWFSGAALPWQ